MGYLINELLHAGSSTRVMGGVDASTGARVALKMPRGEAPAPEVLERLRHEHAMLSEVGVPGVIRVLGIEPCAQGLMLVMERWGESSLDAAIKKGPLPVGAALRLGAEVARALGEVHRRGIIHRDVKPPNVLVDAARTEVKLIDFGIATRRARHVEADAAAEELAGTLAYMAPEQTGRMNRAIDTRVDLYALGATLYQMLTGELPFATSNVAELIHAHIARTPPPVHERAKERKIPAAVSAIVARLMQKSPDARYQTADGAAHDLARAAEAWERTGTVAPFALAAHDWEDRIRKPSRLFGRDPELEALGEAFEAVCQGEVAVTLVAGPSGVGKSALVHALREQVRERQGIFAPGKFDLLQRGTPYAALSQALRSVVRRRLGDPAEVLAGWKAAWQDAAGPNGRILVDLIPELSHLLGETPPLVEVGPQEAKTRFQQTVQRFVRATATSAHPLVLFLDDLQWADPASLSLLQEIVADPDAGHLWIIGAYRDNEAGEDHPLHAMARAVEEGGRHVRTLVLAPLGAAALEQMVGDMLARPTDEVRTLSDLVNARTDGSPFFVEQFLRALHEQRLLTRDRETGRWLWEAESIERAGVTDNVGELLATKIGRLSPAVRRVLSRAACAGSSFEPALLVEAEGRAPQALEAALAELLHEGLIVALGDADPGGHAFVHDRVQQAAYEAIAAEERPAAHLALARALERRHGDLAGDAELFATLDHYVRALPLLVSAQERLHVAALCLRGGQRAKLGSAYAEAAGILRAGRELLGDAGWDEHPARTFDTHLALGEAEWLAGRPEVGEPLFGLCMARAEGLLMRSRVALVWATLLRTAGRLHDALRVLRPALAELGWSFPDEPAELQAFSKAQFERLAPTVRATSADAWSALPRCTEPLAHVAQSLLSELIISAAFSSPAFVPCSVFALLENTFQRGISPGSSYAAGVMAMLCIVAFHDIELAARCVDFVRSVLHDPRAASGLAMAAGCATAHYTLPMPETLAFWREAPAICEREGSISALGFCLVMPVGTRLLAGEHLASCVVPPNLREAQAREYASVYSALVPLLTQRAALDSAAIRRIVELPTSSDAARSYTAGSSTLAALHALSSEEALAFAVEGEPLYAASFAHPSDIMLLEGITILGAAHRPKDPVEAEKLREKVAFHRTRLGQYAAFNPSSFLHVKLLADAGEARAEGRHEDAARLYDEAIDQARRSGFVNDEALGLRLAGEMYLALGRERIARAYLRDAHDGYTRWGAHAVAASLRGRHPEFFDVAALVEPAVEPRPRGTSATTASSTSTVGVLNASIDIAAVLRSAQALAGDMVLGSLVGRVLRLLAENAGAERAALALVREGDLRVTAQLSVEPETLETALDEPVAGSTRLPAAVVQYVARSKEPVVLGQATADNRFDEDPYLRERRPASVLAVPLAHQGRLSGVMYLEQPQVANAFPEARVELASLLASQAATAIENATLYAEVQRKTEALLLSNEQLERQVAERTAELCAAKDMADKANKAKSDFLASMSHELRTPLNSILGYASILERMYGADPGARDGLRVIRASGEHLLTLINDVLDLAKIEAGKMDLSTKYVNLSVLVRTAANVCRVRAEQKGLAFTYEVEGATLVGVRADEKRLMQVLLNLLGNAIKFTERGRVHFTTSVLEEGSRPAECRARRRTVRFRVEDTGPGISPEHVARIFDPFEQAGDPRARAEGTGLGLSICKRIVDLMAGRIEVESELGKGSVFTVTLHLPEAASEAGDASGGWENVVGYRGERRAVLIADDSADNRGFVRDLIAPIGFEVVEAEDGEAALRLARERRPAFVVMDLAMPEMDGYEATRRLRQDPAFEGLVIIASSASVTAAEIERSRAAGCDDFLPKPVHVDALLALISRFLDIEWIRGAGRGGAVDEGSAASSPAEPATPPSEEDRAALLEMAHRGSVRGLMQEMARIEAQDGRLGPWIAQLRALVRGFQLKAAQEFLQSSDGAAREA
ncbi:protein kinase domain-containing protein [Polyangium aurulentum]|uniref:protein kinase domain-containing protein n=1 Tax=Polyangium aurulentum TaxID=2567896 RepID=UPI0010ADD7D4|nr:AAA family ATPase [Polyangium aurulentum]UQA57974.1 AAA family ATPase [Polyangium aurulentum]